MFVKLYFLLMCAVFLNGDEGNSVCDDLVSCVGVLIGRSLHTNNVIAKPVNSTSVLNSMNNILIHLSHLIVDAFKNVVKETHLTKDDLNNTVIDVQTFKINDILNFNETSVKVNVILLDFFKNDNLSISTNDDTISLKDIMGNGSETNLPSVESGADWKIATTELPEIDFSTTIPNINNTIIYNETAYPTIEEPTDEEILSKLVLEGKVESKYLPTKEHELNNIGQEEKAFTNVKVTNISLNITKRVPSDVTISDQPMSVDMLKHLNLKLLEQQQNSKESIFLNDDGTKFNETVDKNDTVSQNISDLKNENKEESTTLHEASKDDYNDLKNDSSLVATTSNVTNNFTSTTIKSTDYYDYDQKKTIILDYSMKKQDQMIPITKTISDDFSYIEYPNINENGKSFDDDGQIEDESVTDYLGIDYLTLYKDTTVEDVKYTVPTVVPSAYRAVPSTNAPMTATQVPKNNGIESIYPWIATLFIKDNEIGQFQYICDGSLVSDRVVLTAARCVTNATQDVANVLVILGKRSLQEILPDEKIVRVKQIKLHEAFTATGGIVENDLAIIVLNEAISFNNDTHPVKITDADMEYYDDDNAESDDLGVQEKELLATTGWHVTGPITPIYFEEAFKCATSSASIFCAVIADGVNTCPSFGGAFVSRSDKQWSLRGIMSGAPTSSGVCFNKKVTFTNISHYYPWIMANIDNINKNQQ